jgi:16S rRNA C1402 (ribose-2'-O) methylase RsmI
MRDTLGALLESVGDAEAAVAREVTKLHENLVVRPISGHLAQLGEPRGEYTIVVRLAKLATTHAELPDSSDLLHEFDEMTERTRSRPRETVRALATKYGRPTREIYERLEEAKHLVK